MKTIKLNEREVCQLYILAMLFSTMGELRKGDYLEDGPARTLARKVAGFLEEWPGGLTISKGE